MLGSGAKRLSLLVLVGGSDSERTSAVPGSVCQVSGGVRP